MTAVWLSPHPDDAVWSCGGRIAVAARARDVIVLTVFDGSSAVPSSVGGWRRIADPGRRNEENRVALDALGVVHVSLGWPDAALRWTAQGPAYRTPRALFGAPHADDLALVKQVTEQIARLEPVEVHAPLACGSHVDHVLTGRAARELRGVEVFWYEDFPYPGSVLPPGLGAEAHPVDLEAWVRAGSCYSSQIDAFFGSVQGFRAAVCARAAAHAMGSPWSFAERVWRSSAST